MSDHTTDEKTANDVVKQSQYGALQINADALENSYEYIDEEEYEGEGMGANLFD